MKQIKGKPGDLGGHVAWWIEENKTKPVTSAIGDAVESERATSAAIGDAAESERATSAIGDAAGSARAMSAIDEGRAAPIATMTPIKIVRESSRPEQEPAQGLPETLPAALPATAGWQRSYTVIKRLAGGTFGEVYAVKPNKPDSGLPPIFVVKLMPKTKQKARATSEHLRDIALVKELGQRHPNILKLLGWKGTHFNVQLFFEFYNMRTHFNVQLFFEFYNMNLRKFINRSPVTQGSAKMLASGVFSAVDYVHSHALPHRDIKPDNILAQSQPLAATVGDYGRTDNAIIVISRG